MAVRVFRQNTTMNSLTLLDTFGNVAAEDDAVLITYFLETEAVKRISSNDVFLVLGRKGSGKTALVRHFAEGPNARNSKSLNLRGYPWPLHAERIDRGASQVEAFVSSWRYLIAVELGILVLRHANGDDSLDKRSLIAFFKDNYGGVNPALGDILRPSKIKLSKLSFEPQILGNKLGGIALERTDLGLGRELDALTDSVLLAVRKNIAGYVQLPSLLLHFDELDQGLLTMDVGRQQMLIGLILAARSIRQACRTASTKINPVIYLRTDLWEEMKFSDKNKITQSLALNLEWNSQSLKDLVNARLRTKLNRAAEWEKIAGPELMRGSQAKWDHILTRTFLRPRDLIQFLNSALEQAKTRTQVPLIFENQDIVDARDRYSVYLKQELDDEIVPHWNHWDDALRACSAIATITFNRDQFIEEYNNRKSKDNVIESDEALRFLYEFSVLGYERRSGYGGSSWVFRYINPEAGWDSSSSRFKIHLGLKEYAKLREERTRDD